MLGAQAVEPSLTYRAPERLQTAPSSSSQSITLQPSHKHSHLILLTHTHTMLQHPHRLMCAPCMPAPQKISPLSALSLSKQHTDMCVPLHILTHRFTARHTPHHSLINTSHICMACPIHTSRPIHPCTRQTHVHARMSACTTLPLPPLQSPQGLPGPFQAAEKAPYQSWLILLSAKDRTRGSQLLGLGTRLQRGAGRCFISCGTCLANTGHPHKLKIKPI